MYVKSNFGVNFLRICFIEKGRVLELSLIMKVIMESKRVLKLIEGD